MNIAYTYDQLRKSKACNESKGYNKIAQLIKKCKKVCAIHISKINLVRISENIKPSHGGFGQFFPNGTYTGICYEKYHEKKSVQS